MSNNNLTASIDAQYPLIWSNSGCATCVYFSPANTTDCWGWKCEHPNSEKYVESDLASPRAECPGHRLTREETTKRIYAVRDLLQRDYGVEIVVVFDQRDSIQVNDKLMTAQTALALLTNLYKSHTNYKQALDRLNYCRYVLKIQDIK